MPKRGNPDWHEVIHYMTQIHGKDEPLCRNGAWNLRYTTIRNRTTCEACRERLIGRNK